MRNLLADQAAGQALLFAVLFAIVALRPRGGRRRDDERGEVPAFVGTGSHSGRGGSAGAGRLQVAQPSVGRRFATPVWALASLTLLCGVGAAGALMVGATDTYEQTVEGHSPAAYWQLGEGSGNFSDSGTNGNTATANGGITYGVTGPLNGDGTTGITLDGSSGYAEAADSSSLDPTSAITLEGWANPTSGSLTGGAFRNIIDKGYTSANWPYIQYGLGLNDTGGNPNSVSFSLAIAGSLVQLNCNNTGWSYGAWNHVVGAYDGTTMRVYVNGQQVCDQAQTGSMSTYSTAVDIGAYPNWPKTSAFIFQGSLNHVAVYPSALTGPQVLADYAYVDATQGGASSTTSRYTSAVISDSPVAYWRLDEASPGPYFRDRTSNHNDQMVSQSGVTFGQGSALNSDANTSIGLDGSSGYSGAVDSSSLNPTSHITLEGWANPTSGTLTSSVNGQIIDKGYETTSAPYVQYGLGLNNSGGTPNSVSFSLAIGGSIETLTCNNAGWSFDKWNHIVGTYDGANMRVYVNGKEVCSQAQAGSITTYPTSVDIGAYPNWPHTSAYLFQGGLDDVAVYSTALSATRVNAHYLASGDTPAPTGGAVAGAEHHGGGNSAGACSSSGVTQGTGGDPVDTESGNFAETVADIAIPGRSCPLEVARTYNSASAATDGPFGYGWTFNDGMSLAVTGSSPNQIATITQENGAQITFNEPASGSTWAPSAPRFIATLTYNSGSSTWTFVRQGKDTYTFNASGQFTAIADPNGYTTTLTYTSGNLTTVTDPSGRTLTLAWTGSHITSVTDANVTPNRTVSYGYDGSGNLTSVTDVIGGTSSFAYTTPGNHLITTMKDPKCDALGGGCPGVQNHYDGSSRVDWQKDQLNRETTFAYAGTPGTGDGGTTTITDPESNVTVDGYQWGVRTYSTRGYGTASAATSSVVYDPNTLAMTATMDPLGNITTYTGDASGNILTSSDPLGRVTTNTYNGFNELLTTQDPNGVTTTNTYDGDGNLTRTCRPLPGGNCGGTPSSAQVTTYNHADGSHPGDVTSVVDPDSKTTTLTYDSYGDRASSTDPLSNEMTSTYNADGFLLTTVSPKGNVGGCSCASAYTTTNTYNKLGELLTSTDPLSHVVTKTYDVDGNLATSEDPNGNTTSYTYDVANELITTTRPDTTTTVTDYNDDGTVLDQKDGKGTAILTYTYDSLARPTTSTDPLSNVTTFTYDAAGNRLTQQDPGGNCATPSKCTTTTYDADNEPTAVTYSDGVTPNITSITYDSDGQRTGMTDGTGTSAWVFDNLHRVTSYTNGNGVAVSYAHNLRNEPTTITYPAGHTVTNTYDNAGRMSTVEDWLGSPNTTTFGYDENSNLTSDTLQSGIVDTYTFNAANQQTAISDVNGGTTIFAATYTRDSNGQLASDNSQAANQAKYKYTSLNQLCYAGAGTANACTSPPGSSYPYGFDAADNLTTIENAGHTGTNAQQFNTDDELCWSVSGASANSCGSAPAGATAFSYDDRGNRTSQVPNAGSATCTAFDEADRLTSVKTGTGSSCTSPTTVGTYAYDGSGMRQSKTVSGTTTQFLSSGSGSPQALLDEKAGSANPTYYLYGPGGRVIEQVDPSGGAHFYHCDQIGSVRAVTNSGGTTDATYTYDPYGNVVTSTNPGSITNNLQFQGQYADAESGLYYLRARYYDPTTAQFISLDPAVASTMSPYAYVAGNPVNGGDPSGLIAKSDLSSDQITQLHAVCSHMHYASCEDAAFCADESSCGNLQVYLDKAASDARQAACAANGDADLTRMAKEFQADANVAGISAEFYRPDRTGAFFSDWGEGAAVGGATGAGLGCAAAVEIGCGPGFVAGGGVGVFLGAVTGGLYGIATGKEVQVPYSTEIDMLRGLLSGG